MPRTTVDAIVRRLLEQGLISKDKVSGHYEYQVRLSEVADKLDWVERRLRPTQCRVDETIEEALEPENTDEKIVNEGEDLGSYEEHFANHTGDRVRLMLARGHNGIEECIERLAGYISLSIQEKLKLEVLVCAAIADSVRDGAGTVPLPPRSDMVRFNIVPVSYCTANTDMLIFRNIVLVVDPVQGAIEQIRSSATVESIKHLLDVACETGWSVDLTSWVGE